MGTAVSAAPARTLPALRHTPLSFWHLLSLDAPSVAALWAIFTALSFGVHLPAVAPIALALAVWMLYAGDRLSDARHGTNLEERHRFHHRHRFAFLGALLGGVPMLALLVALLPEPLRAAWLLLALPLAAYVAVVHGLRWRIPKEHLVGLFFALAVAAPAHALGGVSLSRLLPFVCCFGALCWLNCAAIARWEHAPRTAMDGGTAWAASHFQLALLSLLPLCMLCAAMGEVIAALAVVLSCVLLGLLDRFRDRLAPVTLRACADAALLTPAPVWILVALTRR